MSSDYTFDLPVTPEQVQAIGMIALEWSRLESVIEAAIWQTGHLWDDDHGAAVTTNLQWRARLDILATLYHLHVGESHWSEQERDQRLAEFDTYRKSVEGLARQRAKFVHSRWVRGDRGSPLMYVVQARGELTREKRGWSASEMRDVAAGIQQLAREISEFFDMRMGPHTEEDES
jgi:hypothetical protein